LPLVSNRDEGTLPIVSDAQVFPSFPHAGKTEHYDLETMRGIYFYVLEGRPIRVSGNRVPALGSVMITEETAITVIFKQDAELYSLM